MKTAPCNHELHCGGCGSSRPARGAFTLLEIMIVVFIMGLVLAMGVPAIYSAMHRPPLSQAIVDVVDSCVEARARAILQNRVIALRIFPESRLMTLGDAGATAAPSGPAPSGDSTDPAARRPVAQDFSRTLSDRITFDVLDVNFYECKYEDMATVRFFPNGTSDELTIVLHSDTGEYRKIKLDLITAVAEVLPFP